MAYQRGTGFVGLQQYLGANDEQAKRMGQGLTNQVNAEGQAAQTAIDQGVKNFDTAASVGTPTYTGLSTGLETGEEAADLAGKAAGSVYTGPKALGDVADVDALRKRAVGASQTAGLASTDAGRATLLTKGATGTYGLGARSLDAYLAGRGGGAELDAATTKYGKLPGAVDAAVTRAAAGVKQGIADAASVGKQYTDTPLPQHTYGPGPVGGIPKRNVIETPGTMKDKARKPTGFDRFGSWLFGG